MILVIMNCYVFICAQQITNLKKLYITVSVSLSLLYIVMLVYGLDFSLFMILTQGFPILLGKG